MESDTNESTTRTDDTLAEMVVGAERLIRTAHGLRRRPLLTLLIVTI